MTDEVRKTMLQEAIESRQKEVAAYDINILNFTSMIDKISTGQVQLDDDETFRAVQARDLADFLQMLVDRLTAERLQRGRSQMVLDALNEQLAAIPG